MSCRKFPIKTDFGSHFDCVGLREMREVIENIANDTPHSTKPRSYNSGRDGKENPQTIVQGPSKVEHRTTPGRSVLGLRLQNWIALAKLFLR
ncbi:hypothetical protein AKJ62_02800 [candidate division MSBL1 archaeon SCGC-AAA259D14]|uniref:Uncharacterized protein n=1 Tax=candidate division MSBL1 archaeon SCGC-AAA259D14 TaxID=1698261 RepID=A0A133U5X7_9EURY|nr:hypothetical protein AKJ62_02800 [candidate division MSBL1 archaeon SCGC-AAA259D14]